MGVGQGDPADREVPVQRIEIRRDVRRGIDDVDRGRYRHARQRARVGKHVCCRIHHRDRGDLRIRRQGRFGGEHVCGVVDDRYRRHLRIGRKGARIGQDVGDGVGYRNRVAGVGDQAQRVRIAERLRGGEIEHRRSGVRQRDRGDRRVTVECIQVGRDRGGRVGDIDRIARVGDLGEESGVADEIGDVERQRRGARVRQRHRGNETVGTKRVDGRGNIRGAVGDVDRERRIDDLRQHRCIADRLRDGQAERRRPAVGQDDLVDRRIRGDRIDVRRDVGGAVRHDLRR